MENYHNIDINIYETGPIDWAPFDAMEQFDEFEKRIKGSFPWDAEARFEQNLAIAKALVKASKEYSDEINKDATPYVSILPNGNSIIVFNNVHKGSAVIASTFNLKGLFDISGLERVAWYSITPSEYSCRKPN